MEVFIIRLQFLVVFYSTAAQLYTSWAIVAYNDCHWCSTMAKLVQCHYGTLLLYVVAFILTTLSALFTYCLIYKIGLHTQTHKSTFHSTLQFAPMKQNTLYIPLDIVTFNEHFIYDSIFIFISLLATFYLAATRRFVSPFQSSPFLLAAIKLAKYFMRFISFALL